MGHFQKRKRFMLIHSEKLNREIAALLYGVARSLQQQGLSHSEILACLSAGRNEMAKAMEYERREEERMRFKDQHYMTVNEALMLLIELDHYFDLPGQVRIEDQQDQDYKHQLTE